jgi:hypothetical protein
MYSDHINAAVSTTERLCFDVSNSKTEAIFFNRITFLRNYFLMLKSAKKIIDLTVDFPARIFLLLIRDGNGSGSDRIEQLPVRQQRSYG